MKAAAICLPRNSSELALSNHHMGKVFILAGLLFASVIASRADQTNLVRFTGKVTDANSNALSGVSVVINRVSGAPLGIDITTLKATSGPNGAYELSLALRSTSAKNVECELWFEQKGFVRAQEVVPFPANTDLTNAVNPALHPGQILSGVIRSSSAARPIKGSAQNPLVFLLSSGDWEQAFVAGTNGAFEIYVPPGEYRFSLLTGHPFDIGGIRSGSTNLVIQPNSLVWSEKSVGKVFDDFWRAMDSQYSYFFLKTNVDWQALRDQYRSQAVQCKSSAELAKVLQDMLSPLHDMHVWIESPVGLIGTVKSSYTFNGNGKVTRAAIDETALCGKFALVGKTKREGFGYFLMLRQGNATPDLVKQAVTAIDQLKDAPGFIVDLRAANGGNESLAQVIAQRFCAKTTVYAKSKYRNGPAHTDFSRDNQRELKAGDHPFTKPVVCIIGPGAVSSGEGFVKMMKALPHVTTVGMPTRGASGNPKPFEFGETGLTVMFSRWVDMLPNGELVEGRGIAPEITVDEPTSAYTDRDPTLEKALEILRSKTSAQ